MSETPDDLVTRWALARLDIVTTGTIQADVAYQDFCEWCSAYRLAALTPQMFGRRFTKVHAGMGGKKVDLPPTFRTTDKLRDCLTNRRADMRKGRFTDEQMVASLL